MWRLRRLRDRCDSDCDTKTPYRIRAVTARRLRAILPRRRRWSCAGAPGPPRLNAVPCYSAAIEPRSGPSRAPAVSAEVGCFISERSVASKRATRPALRVEKIRCGWVPAADEEYTRYHDEEWGRPVQDDRHLFEMLTLEGA